MEHQRAAAHLKRGNVFGERKAIGGMTRATHGELAANGRRIRLHQGPQLRLPVLLLHVQKLR